MTRLPLLFFALPTVLVAGCGSDDRAPSPPLPQIGAARQAIVHGDISPPEQNAVVFIANTTQCSGTLIAPTLVLTARHCLVHLKDDFFDCAPGQGQTFGITDSLDPHPMEIYVGNTKPLGTPVAHGKEIRSAGNLDLCRNDVAILVIDTPVTNVETKPIRLDGVTTKGEGVVEIGWGYDDRAALSHERKQRAGTVLSTGPDTYQPPGNYQPMNVPQSILLADTGGCSGDSGGPLLSSKTGAIIGTFSFFSPFDNSFLEAHDPGTYCGQAVAGFGMLSLQKDWILETFEREGYTPWLEGRVKPQAFAAACTDRFDCESGFCLKVGGTSMCSNHCDDAACPAGSECIGSPGNRVCAFPLVAAPPGDSTTSGCALSSNVGRPAWLAWPLVMLASTLVGVWRRRKRSPNA